MRARPMRGSCVARASPGGEGTGFLLLAPVIVRIALPFVAAMTVLALPGCDRRPAVGERDGIIAVTDDAGRTVTLPRPARRVISLIPAQTEVVQLLAGTEVLVARTQWDLDAGLAHLPSTGNALTPSVEWLAAQRPDLVIAWRDVATRDVVQRLAEIGIPVYSSSVESIDQIRAMIARLGVLLDAEARADSLIARLDAELEAVRAAVAGRPRPRVIYLLSAEPALVAGPGTFAHELIDIAGGENIFGDVHQHWPQIALEEIVRRRPDVIIRATGRDPAHAVRDLAGRAGWRDLAAVREGRVYGVDENLYNRAGVTVGRAAAGLAERIHRDLPAPLPQ
jgi:ABC-type Fe3+-hydroxamate transport system substrate-binding protein